MEELPEIEYDRDRDRLKRPQSSWMFRAMESDPFVSCQSVIELQVSPVEVESQIDVSSVVSAIATRPQVPELVVEGECDRDEIWTFSSGNPLQFWEKNFLRTTMNLIVGVLWAVMVVLSQQFFPPGCRDIFLGHVARASSSDRKNPKNRRKRNWSVYDQLFFVQLGCSILVLVISRHGVACLGLIALKISSLLVILVYDSSMAGWRQAFSIVL